MYKLPSQSDLSIPTPVILIPCERDMYLRSEHSFTQLICNVQKQLLFFQGYDIMQQSQLSTYIFEHGYYIKRFTIAAWLKYKESCLVIRTDQTFLHIDLASVIP